MSASDLSAKALAQLAERAGADPQKAKAVPLPAYLLDRSVLLYRDLKGSSAYKTQLENTAKDLYQQITTDPSVLSHLASGKSVLGDDNKRGVIKPFQPKHEGENRQALTWLLHSIAFVASTPTAVDEGGKIRDLKYVAVPLTSSAFGKGKDKYPLKRDRLAQMVYALAAFHAEDDPWVDLYAGRFDDASGMGLVTRLEPLTPIKDFLVRHQLVFAGHPQPKMTSKDEEEKSILYVNVAPKGAKQPVKHPLRRELSDSETVLPELNKKLIRQKLTLHLPDYAFYRSHWDDSEGTSRLMMVGSKQLYRSFRFEDGKAGRLYGHFVQRLPGAARKHLRIDNQPVVELDYSAMQLVMLYADKGVSMPEGDLYELVGGKERRDVMKTVLTHSVGNATKDKTVQSLKGFFVENGLNPSHAEPLYDRFWAVHKDVCPHDSEQGPWPWLQNIDSEIALRVLRLLYDQGIDAIPIHDSFIVKARHKDALEVAMQQAWQERYPDTDIGIK